MKDYIALVTVELHKFDRRVAEIRLDRRRQRRRVGWADEWHRSLQSLQEVVLDSALGFEDTNPHRSFTLCGRLRGWRSDLRAATIFIVLRATR